MSKRAEILQLARDLYLDRGYAGFSYQDISGKLGIKNAAVHYHFPTKQDLILAVIEEARSKFLDWSHRASIKALPADQRLFEMIHVVYEALVVDGIRVCEVGNSAASFELLSDRIRETSRGLTEDIISWIDQVLKEGRSAKLFVFDGDCRGKATLIAGTLAGSLQLARISGKEHFYRIVEQLKKDIINSWKEE